MELLELKTWVIFYLVCLVTLLWAVFLSAQGVMLGISLTLEIVVVGINCAIVLSEVRNHIQKRDRMKKLMVLRHTEKPQAR
jgi:positive regulator of sigma E activity